MSLLENLIYTALKNNAALTAQVSTRIYPVMLPQDVDLPSVSYSKVSGYVEHSQDGFSELIQCRIQFDSWATTYKTASEIIVLIRKAIQTNFKGAMFSAPIDFYEPETRIFHVTLDAEIWHQEE